MKRLFVLAAILLAACSGTTGPVAVTLRPIVHDPEIFFHFFYHRDAPGAPLHTEPYPDTAFIRWYQGTPSDPTRRLLAQVAITGTDSVCAYFFAPAVDTMYFDLAWQRHGTLTATGTLVGPLRPEMPSEYLPYWDIATSEDTVNISTSADIASRAGPSYCPPGVRRDSITP